MITKQSNSKMWKEQLGEAVAYAKRRGWTVEFRKNAESSVDAKHSLVLIQSNRTLRNQFYMLVHELGHVLMFSKRDYADNFLRLNGKYSLQSKVLLLEEELLAWREGENLAKKQGWKLDNHFEVLKSSMISSYCLWATHRKHPYKRFMRG